MNTKLSIYTIRKLLDRQPRRVYLTVMGMLYIALGLLWWLFPTSTNGDAITWLPEAVSIHLVALCWVLTGLVAIVCGSLSVPGRQLEWRGFMALQAMALSLSLYFLLSYILTMTPPPTDGGDSGGLPKAVIYLTFYVCHSFMARAHSSHDIAPIVETMTGQLPTVERDEPERG